MTYDKEKIKKLFKDSDKPKVYNNTKKDVLDYFDAIGDKEEYNKWNKAFNTNDFIVVNKDFNENYLQKLPEEEKEQEQEIFNSIVEKNRIEREALKKEQEKNKEEKRKNREKRREENRQKKEQANLEKEKVKWHENSKCHFFWQNSVV